MQPGFLVNSTVRIISKRTKLITFYQQPKHIIQNHLMVGESLYHQTRESLWASVFHKTKALDRRKLPSSIILLRSQYKSCPDNSDTVKRTNKQGLFLDRRSYLRIIPAVILPSFLLLK
jgi:hypothetical protein